MREQNATKLLMIEPVSFAYNKETAANNYFQIFDNENPKEIQRKALEEFRNLVTLLKDNNIDFITFKDTYIPHTPDSIFPNNWISFHENNIAIIYPMYAQNRRLEKRYDIIKDIYNGSIYNIINLSDFENEGSFLEGTGSMVLDRKNKIAFASLSERTSEKIFYLFCKKLDYVPITFKSYQNTCYSLLVYHTNVMLSMCEEFAIICKEAIPDINDINKIYNHLADKEVIEISINQMHHYAGNVLQVKSKDGCKFLLMSQSAYNSLNNIQLKAIYKHNNILTVPIPTIEKYGGGGVRCMLAELF